MNDRLFGMMSCGECMQLRAINQRSDGD